MNQQIKAGLSAVREFLAGRSNNEKVTAPEDKATREVVAAELLAAMSSAGKSAASPEIPEKSAIDTQKIPRLSAEGRAPDVNQADNSQPASENSVEEQERARQLFVEHGYFDETVQNLRAATSAAERAAAASALGLVGSQRATAHLIAAMFDDDESVRNAAATALNQIGEPLGEAPPASTVEPVDEVKNLVLVPTAAEEPESIVEQPIESVASIAEAPSAVLEVTEVAAVSQEPVEPENSSQLSVGSPDVPPDLIATTAVTANDEDQLLVEEQKIRETLAEIEQQVLAASSALKDSQNEIRWRIEREAKLREEARARQVADEEARNRADEESEARRTEARELVAAELATRLQAEAEAQRYVEEETNLRLQTVSLRLQTAELAQRRLDMEIGRQEAAEAARHAEVMRLRDEARSRHEAELEQLQTEEARLQQATDELLLGQTRLAAARAQAASEIEQLKQEQLAVEIAQRAEAERRRLEAKANNDDAEEHLRIALDALREVEEDIARRRADVDADREKADAEAQRLVEAQARMKATEEARAQAEAERTRLEAKLNEQVEREVRLLEETRRRGEQEQERLKEELRLRSEKEQDRLAELELMKTKAEVESRERADMDRQIRSQIESLRFADSETRRRIEEAEVKRRTADDAYRLIAEKVQRVEAEAHARKKEEERMLSKLESERRNAAIDAQSRAEQEKRIREELEMFRRLEEEERPRIEVATLQLVDAEARLLERKERFKRDIEAADLAAEELTAIDGSQTFRIEAAATVSHTAPIEAKLQASLDESSRAAVGSSGSVVNETGEIVAAIDDAPSGEKIPVAAVTPAIATYLNSVDHYKRAAAVAELARSGSADAFERIAECFDDHSSHVRNAAARALSKLEPDKAVDMFNRALDGAAEVRRRNIGAAIAASGLATEAINNLASESREATYNALSILFVMAKTGEVEPLLRAHEEHRDDEIGKAVAKLLTLSGHRLGEQAAGAEAGIKSS
ncbi:MAG TPA: HEAT repeat domain-containing protein [Pyrinomonadaceae bacterium]|nr:HEAT repeat domain-containing protein [Pyrinomonadaceae bacterium]